MRKIVCASLFIVLYASVAWTDAVFSKSRFKELYARCLIEKKTYSPEYITEIGSGNVFKRDIDYGNTPYEVFIISGKIAEIRYGVFGGYIIELENANAVLGVIGRVNVVYPGGISKKTFEYLANLNRGADFSAVVAGKSMRGYYVDVLCYRENGVLRTEP